MVPFLRGLKFLSARGNKKWRLVAEVFTLCRMERSETKWTGMEAHTGGRPFIDGIM